MITLNTATQVGLVRLADKLNAQGGLGGLFDTQTPAGLAELSYLIRYLPDEPAWFPNGRFAALREVQQALDAYGERTAARFMKKEHFDHDDPE